MPVDVAVNGQVQTVPMTGGHGSIAVAPDAHILIDPTSKLLRDSAAIDRFRDWTAAQKPKKLRRLMADLIFYTNPQSRGQTVRWMLEEVGAPYDAECSGTAIDEGRPYSGDQSDGQGPGDRATTARW